MAVSSERLTLIVGDEELLIDRAVADVVAAARARESEAEVHELTPATLARGALAELTSPSLFGGGRVVVLRSAQDFGKDVIAEIGKYAKDPADDVDLVVVHAGGVKGKALLDALTKAGARKVTCQKITRPGERIAFVRSEVRRAGGSISDAVVPSPSRVVMSKRPRWRSTMCLTIDRPRPVPPAARLRLVSAR